MNLPYLERLICAALSCFFLVYLAATCITAFCARRAIRSAERGAPHRAANLLLQLRLLPFGLAAFVSVGLAAPSYLWFEPEPFDEPVGLFCIAVALLCLALFTTGAVRAAQALIRTARFEQRSRDSRVVALTGIFKPRVVISQHMVNALSDEELSVVISHEHAHRTAHDNLKRLCILLAPGSKALERAWTNFAEYAADQHAVQGDQRRSVALASALVRVARMGGAQRISAVATSFLGDASALAARVDRLLDPPQPTAPASSRRKVFIGAALLLISFHPTTLRYVHSLLEALLSLVVLP